jgi:UDP-N-acetylmuramoylalanine--D-glutamate ligase
MNGLNDQRVLVLGLGDSGLAMARWCARHGAQVRVWDSREAPPQAATLAAELPGATLQCGELPPEALGDATLVLKSPGLAPTDARVAPLLAAARARGVAVAGELALFARALADLRAGGWAPQVLAITGTNGKTTTTSLTGLLVRSAGRRVAVAGNIGPTLLDTLAQALDGPAEERPEVFVLELSSFQLDGVDGFEPDAAAVLNLTQDHLDWHGDMAAYGAAKARIWGRQGVVIYNRDDAAVVALARPRIDPPAPEPVRGPKGGVLRADPPPPAQPHAGFGGGAPQAPGDWGLVTEGGMAWLVRAPDTEDAPGARRGRARRAVEDEEPATLQRLMPVDALQIRGRHNAANALAALALATAIGCPLAPMLHALRDYRGEPHRVESLGVVGGIEVFDDSKGTNVGATVAAIDGLGADRAPAKLSIILGGDGKGQDFGPLAAPVAGEGGGGVVVGRDAPAIAAVLAGPLADADVPMQPHDSLPDAVRWALAQSREGDALLLSPACASLDMFRNYGHRAEVFAQAVRDWAADRGEVLA